MRPRSLDKLPAAGVKGLVGARGNFSGLFQPSYNIREGEKQAEVDVMTRIGAMASAVLLAMSLCYGQKAAPAPAQPASATQTPSAATGLGHGAFPVQVTKMLDSSKLKQGDIVEFKTAGAFVLPDGRRVPEGAMVTGHVTEAKARSKGDSQSELAVVFDQISLAKGEQLTIKGIVQAVGPNPFPDATQVPNGPTMQAHGGGNNGGWTPTTDIKSGSDLTKSTYPSSMVTPESTGVHGIRGLQLGPDGVLTSNGKQVKLDSGVRIIVRGEILK